MSIFWMRSDQAKPEAGRPVLVYWKNELGNGRITRAEWHDGTTVCLCEEPDICLSIEGGNEDGEHFLTPGWYEAPVEVEHWAYLGFKVSHWAYPNAPS